MGYMNFFPLEPQEPSEEYNDNTPNKRIEAETQDKSKELGNVLKNGDTQDDEIKDIEPLQIRNDQIFT